MTDVIGSTAKASSRNLPVHWRFLPVTRLLVNDTVLANCELGEVFYESPLYIISAGLRVKDWVFCLERLSPLAHRIGINDGGQPNEWWLGAFHGDDHYLWDKRFAHEEKTREQFMAHVLARFYEVLHGQSMAAQSPLRIQPEGGLITDAASRAAQFQALDKGHGLGGGVGTNANGTWTAWPPALLGERDEPPHVNPMSKK